MVMNPLHSGLTAHHVLAGDVGRFTEIADLLELMHDEAGIGELNREKVESAIADVAANGVCLLWTDDDGTVASMGLKAARWWYSDDAYLKDLWFYVSRDRRQDYPYLAEAMLRAAQSVANHHRLPLLLGILSQDRPTAKARLYTREGFQPIGAALYYQPLPYAEPEQQEAAQ